MNEVLLEWMEKKEELSTMDEKDAEIEYEKWKKNFPNNLYHRKDGKMMKIEKDNK